jgi:hypothetical protein
MITLNRLLDGENIAPKTAAQARALIGKRVQYLRISDIDYSGRGYFFPRVGVIEEVRGRDVRMDGGAWYSLGSFREMREATGP